MTDSSGPASPPNPPRPSGWYADPQQPVERRYGDGETWGKQFKDSARTSRGQRPVGRGFERLAALLGCVLVVAMLVLIAKVALYIWGFVTIGDAVESGDIDLLTTFDHLDRVLSASVLGAVVVGGLCWMFWQHRVARAVPGLERSPAMHAFSWIIPIGALWLPFQNVRDLWRRCARGGTTAIVGWWWTGWLVGVVGGRLVYGSSQSVHSVSDFKSVLLVGSVVALITVVTGVLAIRIVRVVSAGVTAGDFVDVRRAQIDPLGLPDRW